MIFLPKRFLIYFIILALFLVYFKFARFEALSYFLDDFTNNLEGSYSWLLGRPLTFANGFGKLNTAHNYFLMPLLGPIALYFGAKGMFVLLVIANALVWFYFYQTYKGQSVWFIVLLVFLLVNPTFLWIFDHPDVGWSIEMLYYPLAILYAISLKMNFKKSILVFALLLMAVREEGIILVAMIHISFIISQLSDFKSIFYNRRIWVFGVSYSLLFCLSLYYLALKGNSNSFVESAFAMLKLHFHDIKFHTTNLAYLVQALLLISPFVGYHILFQKIQFPQFLFFLLFLFLLFALTFFQTIRYYDKFYFQIVSITWAIRFILPFTFTIAFLILNSDRKLPDFTVLNVKAIVFIFLFFSQFLFISFVRQDVSYTQIAAILLTQKPQHRMQDLVQPADIEHIRKIEKALPTRSSIYVGDFLVPIFSNHFIVWPDRYKEFEKADIAIIPKGNAHIHLKNELPLVMKKGYRLCCTFGAYEMYAIPTFSLYCLLK